MLPPDGPAPTAARVLAPPRAVIVVSTCQPCERWRSPQVLWFSVTPPLRQNGDGQLNPQASSLQNRLSPLTDSNRRPLPYHGGSKSHGTPVLQGLLRNTVACGYAHFTAIPRTKRLSVFPFGSWHAARLTLVAAGAPSRA